VPHETNFQKPQIAIHLSARSALVRLAAEKKFSSPPQNLFQPQSSSTSITVSKPYCSSPTKHTGPSPTSCHPPTLLKTHSHRAPPHRGAASFKSLYQKRPPQILIRLPIFSSAVASDTTLGLLARPVLCGQLPGFPVIRDRGFHDSFTSQRFQGIDLPRAAYRHPAR
jgi:hypothetical protein